MYKILSSTRVAARRALCRSSGASVSCYPCDPCDPGVNVTIIHNGIRIATEYQPSPLTCMTMLVEAGSRFETAHLNGVTHFLEHMAYKGFCSMSRKEHELGLLLNGAKMTAETSREIQTFTGTFPTEYGFLCMLDNLAAVVTNLQLNCREMEMEKYNICLEMIDEDNDPKSVVFDYLHQTAFQGTPLAQRVIGTTNNVSNFDRETLRTFFCQHYQPYKFTLSTVGDVCHDTIVNAVIGRLGHLCGNPCFESDDGPTRFTGSQVIYRNDSMPFAHVAIAFEAPGYNHPDYWKCLVAKNIIGSWHKSVGGGYKNAPQVAQAGAIADVCDSYESFYITYRDVGLWGIYFVSKRMSIEDMVENVQDAWKQMIVTMQYGDMQRGLNATKLELAREVSGVVNSCRDIGRQLLYKCTRLSLEDKLFALSVIKLDELRECMDGLMYDKCPVVVAVGPTENLPDYSRIRAGQYWVRL